MCNKKYHIMEEMKKKIILIAVTAVLLVGAIWVEKNCNLATWQLLIVYLIPYLIIGHETLMEAAEGIAHGEVFDEDFLMAIATIGALCIGFFPDSETEFPEAVFVMLFFQVGELFEGYAEGKSRDSISHLMDIRPDVANVERKSLVETVSPEEVKVGEVIVVRPGEKVPLDGVVVEGSSALNTLALTGESVPRDLNEGDEVVSGCINLTGVIRVRTTKNFGESTVSKIIALVESADENKSKSEAFITRFARVYTPAVFAAALIWSTAARTGWSVLGLPIGAAVLLGGLLGTAVWLCRYAAAPLLLLEGFPAGAALQLSVRIMRGHRAALIDRFGSRLPAMLGCLLLLPVPWLLPRLRIGRTALLVRWRQQTVLPGGIPVPPGDVLVPPSGAVKTGR